jgi:hypothetical protein
MSLLGHGLAHGSRRPQRTQRPSVVIPSAGLCRENGRGPGPSINTTRHNQRLLRKARSLSLGWKRPPYLFPTAVFSMILSFMAKSASM